MCGYALLVTPFAAGLTFVESIYLFLPGLWCLLFLGACIVPTCYGIMVSSCNKELQSASSAFGQIFFNMFGYFAAPIASGYVIDQFDSERKGLTRGYRLILWSNALALIFLVCALILAFLRERKSQRKQARAERRRQSESETGKPPVD